MKTFGMKINITTILMMILFTMTCLNNLHSQCDPTPPTCNSNTCDDVKISLNSDDNNVFCQGNSAIIEIDESESSDFDILIYYWCDGTVDTLNFSDQPGSHQYIIPEEQVCNSSQTDYFIRIIGVKYCSAGESCRTTGVSLTILHEPRADFDNIFEYCIGEEITFNNLSCNATEYLWDFGDGTTLNMEDGINTYSAAGQYTVKLTAENECGTNVKTTTINIVEQPESNFNISPLPVDNKICAGQILEFTNQSNIWSNTTWDITPSGDNNWCFTDTLMTLNSDVIAVEFKNTTTYTVRLIAENACGQDTEEVIIQSLDGPTVILGNGPTFCETALYTPDVSYNGDITDYFWEFPGGNPSSSNDPFPMNIEYPSPGSYDVTLTVSSTCGLFTASTVVNVDSNIDVNITAVNQFCATSSPDTLEVSVAGGTWNGDGIIDSSLGIFDPNVAGIGTHNITYTIGSGSCINSESIMINVIPSEVVSTNNESVCQTIPSVQLTAIPAGGTWIGQFVNPSGLFDVAGSGVGTFTPQYLFSDTNGCEITSSPMITVDPLPVISISDTTFLCANGGTIDLELLSNFTTNLEGGEINFLIDNIPVENLFSIGNTIMTSTLTVEYILNSCQVLDSAIISIIEPPILEVTPDTIVCINDGTLQLIGTPTGGLWSGNSISSNGEIDLIELGDGVHDFIYSIFPGSSCEKSGTVMVEVTDPRVNLNAGPKLIEICEDQFSTYTFSDFSPIGGTFSGPGIVDSSGIVDLTQLQKDTTLNYQYCISNPSFDNCEACAETSIIIYSKPTISFEIEGGACIGDSLTIINNSTNAVEYFWDFGDGTTSNDFEPSHIYNISQEFTITLMVTSTNGCSNINSQSLYVSQPPRVDFSVGPSEGCAPLELEFENFSSGDNISYQWLIANDTFTDQFPNDIVLDSVYNDSLFDITLNIINTCGIVSQTEQVLVHPYPIIDLGINPGEGCSPLDIEVNGILLGNPDSYTLNLGNGTTIHDSIITSQTYTTNDSTTTNYTLSLTASNDCGTSVDEETLTVYPPDVMAFIQLDTMSICQFGSFPISSVSTEGSILSWTVIDDQGNLIEGYNEDNPIITLNQSGIFEVILFASRCGTDTDTVTIEVLPAPEVEFSLPPFICLGDSLELENLSIDISESEWDFGNGQTSQEPNPITKFDSIGVFTISLTGYSDFYNCPRTVQKNIEVIGLPIASFEPSVTTGCQPLEVDFENTSLGATNYLWTWGDGTSSTNAIDTSHTFTIDGTYTVTLRAFDNFGCSNDSSIVNIIINPKPISIFELEKNEYCQFHDSIKVNSLSNDISGFNWFFNNQLFDIEHPTFYSDNQGNHSIDYIVENQYGCLDTSSQIVTILPSPIADITTLDTTGCQPYNVNIANFSNQSDSYIWNINNEEFSSDMNLTFLFQESGNQTISLIALNNNDCPSDTTTVNINVLPKPQIDYQFFKDKECGVPMNVNFISNTTDNIIDYNWSFGDGSNSQLSNPSHIFNVDSNFTTELIVENEFSCFDTTDMIIPIWHQPIADFIIDQRPYCVGELIIINNTSQNINTSIWNIESIAELNQLNPTIKFEEEGSYSIELSVEYNEFCKSSKKLDTDIKIFNTPIADFSFIEDVDINIIGEVEYLNESIDYDDILWQLGDGTESTLESFIHEFDINRNITTTLIAYNHNNNIITCSDTIQKTIVPEWNRAFYAPNAFSPNYGSGEHTLFIPKGVGIESYELKVYSKFGNLVWQGSEVTNGQPSDYWNGQILNNGEDVPKGAYIWQAIVNFDGNLTKVYSGNVTVLR